MGPRGRQALEAALARLADERFWRGQPPHFGSQAAGQLAGRAQALAAERLSGLALAERLQGLSLPGAGAPPAWSAAWSDGWRGAWSDGWNGAALQERLQGLAQARSRPVGGRPAWAKQGGSMQGASLHKCLRGRARAWLLGWSGCGDRMACAAAGCERARGGRGRRAGRRAHRQARRGAVRRGRGRRRPGRAGAALRHTRGAGCCARAGGQSRGCGCGARVPWLGPPGARAC